MSFHEIIGKIEESSPLNFGNIFSRSIELFKQVWLQGFITLILTLITILPFYILMYAPLLSAGITDPEIIKTEGFPPEIIVPMIVLIPICVLGMMMMGLILNAGFLRICKQKDFNESGKENYFFYFKKEYIGKTMLLSLMMLGLGLLGMLMCGIGIIYMVVPLSLFPAFLAFDEELTATEIVKSSFGLGNKNWLIIFGLVLLMGLLAELGILLCCIGILFTAMLAKIPIYYVYKDGIGFSTGE